MPQADDPLSDPFIDMSTQSNNKSLRKREREKQRRSDLASAFDELSNLLALVQDSNSPGSESAAASERPTKKAKQEQDSLTRFDLIGGTIQCIRNLHRENQQLKRQLAEARSRGGSSEGGGGGNNEEVLVMLPTLVPADERAASPRAAPAPAPAAASASAAAASSSAVSAALREYSNPSSHHGGWVGYPSSLLAPQHSYYPTTHHQQQPPPASQQGYGYYNPYYYMGQSQHDSQRPSGSPSRRPQDD